MSVYFERYEVARGLTENNSFWLHGTGVWVFSLLIVFF